jgi:hypothetical protein
MRDKPDTSPGSFKMEQALELMDQGRHQEALELALDVLLHELTRLSDALLGLQSLAGPEALTSVLDNQGKPSPSGPPGLPPLKSRIIH